jgi:hypothetical protein
MFTPDQPLDKAIKGSGGKEAGKERITSHQSAQPRLDRSRKLLRFTWIILLGALFYVGFVFYSRRQEYSELERRQSELRTEKQRAEDAKTVEQLGGSQFDILNLYASPARIHPGETAQVCYGVSNAKNVKLEPQSEPVWPSLSRCVRVIPRKTTIYTLTAQDSAGNKKTATVKVEVQ